MKCSKCKNDVAWLIKIGIYKKELGRKRYCQFCFKKEMGKTYEEFIKTEK